MTHHCHWPGCKIEKCYNVFCYDHWLLFPDHIRGIVGKYYQSGHGNRKVPSVQYLEALKMAHDFAIQYELRRKEKMDLLNGIDDLIEEIK